MTTGEGPQSRARSAPTAQCRLCSAVASIDAPTTDQLRISLRRFMADHRHDGLADIVIDISDDADPAEDADDESDVVLSSGAAVSGS
ncbi:MAG TPA: hypothetical protein VFJ17_14535 [Mycobacteriales bacterium]|nr:hypothetical protein [Mycobacteriales bacterium]